MAEGVGGEEAVKLFARVWPYRRSIVVAVLAVFSVVATGYAGYQRFVRVESGHEALAKKYEEHAEDSVTRAEHEKAVMRLEQQERVNQEQGTSLKVIEERLASFTAALASVKYGVDLLVSDRLESSRAKGGARKGKAEK